jgi:hypothetical protein
VATLSICRTRRSSLGWARSSPQLLRNRVLAVLGGRGKTRFLGGVTYKGGQRFIGTLPYREFLMELSKEQAQGLEQGTSWLSPGALEHILKREL